METFCGGWGGEGTCRGKHRSIPHAPDTERELDVPGNGRCAASSLAGFSLPLVMSSACSFCTNAPCSFVRASTYIVLLAASITGVGVIPTSGVINGQSTSSSVSVVMPCCGSTKLVFHNGASHVS